jgi:methylmalonyl-CoA mutase N-terminal domain/subunit
MTINSPAAMIFAMYLVVAEQQGADWKTISGTIQNDILKEFIAQKEYIFPPRPSMRVITDIFAFCAGQVPKWNTISVSGYHIREAGATAVQELAFTLRDGLEYVQWGVDAGLDVDAFVPQISFFFNAHSDFFEEIAKYRAARKIWAEAMRDRFHARNERSWKLRFHTQTAGVSLTAQQPYNNVVRTALQALSAVLGGTNSLHTNSLTSALPADSGGRDRARTQRSSPTKAASPTSSIVGRVLIRREADKDRRRRRPFQTIDAMGRMVQASARGFLRRRSPSFSFPAGWRKEESCGVNAVQQDDPRRILCRQSTSDITEELEALRDGASDAFSARSRCARRRLELICASSTPSTLRDGGEMCDALRRLGAIRKCGHIGTGDQVQAQTPREN